MNNADKLKAKAFKELNKMPLFQLAEQLDNLTIDYNALRKAFEQLLEESTEYRERLGIPNDHYEQDWLIKAKIL